jgi:TolB-like protein
MRWRSTLAMTLAAGLVASTAGMAQDTRPGIAVITFQDGGSYGQEAEDFAALTVGLQQMLITEFAENGALRVVDRGRINELLAEQDLGASGRVDANTAAEIGRVVGAKYTVMGGFVDFYGDLRIDVRIVDTETSEIVKVERARDERENMFTMVVDLADGITKGLSLPPLPAGQLQERQERSSRIDQEAVRLYTRGLLYAERGDTERAIELFSRVTQEFPEYTEAREALRQIQGS